MTKILKELSSEIPEGTLEIKSYLFLSRHRDCGVDRVQALAEAVIVHAEAETEVVLEEAEAELRLD